jgi:hypothetical protein
LKITKRTTELSRRIEKEDISGAKWLNMKPMKMAETKPDTFLNNQFALLEGLEKSMRSH